MFGGQILASGHGQQKGIWCWDTASPALCAKGSLRPLWAVVDRCHSSHHAGCEVRGSSVCSHYLLPRELRRSAGWISVHKGCFSVLQKGLSSSTQLFCYLLACMSWDSWSARMGMAYLSQQRSSALTALEKWCRVLFLIPNEHSI